LGLPHARLKPTMTKDLYRVAEYIKSRNTAIIQSAVLELIQGNYPEDIDIHDNLFKLVKNSGFYDVRHFVEVVLHTSLEELQEAIIA